MWSDVRLLILLLKQNLPGFKFNSSQNVPCTQRPIGAHDDISITTLIIKIAVLFHNTHHHHCSSTILHDVVAVTFVVIGVILQP